MSELNNLRVAVIAEEGFEEVELTEPRKAPGKVAVDRTLDEARPDEYDALMLPGGALKPIAAICPAPWELIPAGVLRGRKLTSWPAIEDDGRNAGAEWSDNEVVIDQNLVTSRGPKDIPAFNRAMIALFARVPAEARR